MSNAVARAFGYHLADDLCAMPEIAELPADALAPALREGLEHHAAGRLAEAAEAYRRVYEQNPDDPDALLLLGIVARQGAQYPAAVQLISLSAKQRPQAAHIFFNLALACLGAGDPEHAHAACSHVLHLQEKNGKAWALLGEIESRRGNFKEAVTAYAYAIKLPTGAARAGQAIGNQLCREKRYEEAIRVYARGVAAEPANANLHFSIGAAAAAMGDRTKATESYVEALKHRPNFPELHLNMGNLFYDAGNFTAAASSYSRAITQRPAYAKAHSNLGNALSEMGRHSKAIACFERALELDPEAIGARHNLGNALLHRREYVRAEECFRAALASDPTSAEHHNSLGNALLQQLRAEEAAACYERALELKKDYAAAHINLANTLMRLGRVEEMKRHYLRGVEIDPASPGGQYNLALLLLREGNYPEGWLRHEWRWDFRELHQPPRRFPRPQWHGEELNGATILLHVEQGLGDTLQFIRYVPMVAARGGRVILEVQPRMQRLLQSIPGVDQILTRGDVLPDFAWHCPLMSLPLAFRTSIETIPSGIPYVHPDPTDVAAAWQAYPRSEGRLRVGLAWAGNPHYKGDEQRSMTLNVLTPLGELPGVDFYSLQFGKAAEQIDALQSRFPVIDTSSRCKDFAETAAVAATLDLVLSVDTSIAHLAGAMGLPVWVMLSHLADWRWLDGRADNPWYPTARLFRQTTQGDWTPVVAELCDALRELISQPGR